MATASVILTAASRSTDAGPNLIPVLTLITSAGIATLLVNIVKGLWANSQVRGPRSRVQAIRDGAETLALLTPGSEPYRAVEKQVLAEAAALAAPRRRWWYWLGSVLAGPDLFSITFDMAGVAVGTLAALGIERSDTVPSGQTSDEVIAKGRRLSRWGIVIFAAAAAVLVLTVASFFAQWAPQTQTVVAAVGGALLVILVSAGSALQSVGSAVARSRDSVVREARQGNRTSDR